MKKEYIRPFLWGGAVGAIVLLIVIFSAGWVVTSGSAQIKAEKMVTSALMNRLAPISVAQFMLDPNKEERLSEMNKLDSWKRGDYVQSRVGRQCQERSKPTWELPMSARDVLLRSNCDDSLPESLRIRRLGCPLAPSREG